MNIHSGIKYSEYEVTIMIMQSGYREHNFFAISIPFISGISISKNTISGITDDESKENAVLKVKIL